MLKPFKKKFKHLAAAREFINWETQNEMCEKLGIPYDENLLADSISIHRTGKQPDGFYHEVQVIITFFYD